MNLKQFTVEDAALEWSHLRPLLRDYGGQVGEKSCVARTLTPVLCLRPSPLRSGSQRKKMKEHEVIRCLNKGLIESPLSVRISN